jgi:hypothetical protein
MQRYPLIAVAVVFALVAAAPAASAQARLFSATYTEKFVGPRGGPPCPDEAFACGSGTAAGVGSFTTEVVFDPNVGAVRTLTFTDGSTLLFDEAFVSFRGPGASGSSNASDMSEGHPGRYAQTWIAAGGTGSFSGATGSGTDNFVAAGLVASGTLSGTITTS